MAKNIVIYSDGTGQAGGKKPDQRLSNIYKMYRATRVSPVNEIHPDEQVAYYDAGLGTEEDVSSQRTKVLKFFQKLLGSVTGRGITRNITDCYEAIINLYEPGDRIYLLGFSRGAYTARCVANVITLCGIPVCSANGEPIRRNHSSTRKIAGEAVKGVYEHGAGRKRGAFGQERLIKADRFRQKYQSNINGEPNVMPYFIGVFDTVAALGLNGMGRFIVTILLIGLTAALTSAISFLLSYFYSWDFWSLLILINSLIIFCFALSIFKSSFKIITHYPKKWRFRFHLARWKAKNYDQALSPEIPFARHAIAIDETRKNFARVPWGFKHSKYESDSDEPEPFIQLWFAGNHSDIGGSYPENESRLSDISLSWMVQESKSLPHPMIYDDRHLRVYPSAAAMQHSEVDAMKERIAKWLPFFPERLVPTWKEKKRKAVLGAPVHASVSERFKLSGVLQNGYTRPYRPSTLAKDPKFESFYTDE